MRILIDLFYKKELFTYFRYEIIKDLANLWIRNGHSIYVNRLFDFNDKFDIDEYTLFDFENHSKYIDVYLCFGIYRKEEMINDLKKFNNDIKILTYDLGWLNNSVKIDKKFFSDSNFYNSLPDIINENFDKKLALKYRSHLIINNVSKREQPPLISKSIYTQNDKFKNRLLLKKLDQLDNLVFKLKGTYVFIPLQKSIDISFNYSKFGMFEFVDKVVNYCKKYDIPVIMKIHPSVSPRQVGMAMNCYERNKKMYDKCYVVDSSIYDLINHARFTVCLNSGTLIDNFVIQSPVLCCANCMFSKVKCMVFSEDIEKGLETMIKRDYDFELMKENQLKILWWLKNHLLFYNLSDEENAKRFNYLSKINL